MLSALKSASGFFVLACLLLLTACGQKGDLYLPEAQAQGLQPASAYIYLE